MIAFVARNQVRWLSLAGALALAGLLAWMLTAPLFEIRSAKAALVGSSTGSVPVDQRPVEDLFEKPQNLFLLSGSNAAERLVDNPEIGWAQVRSRVDGSVDVALQPALAVANWSTPDGYFLVDRAGTALAEGFDPGLELDISSPEGGTVSGIDPAVLESGLRLRNWLPALGFELDYVQYSAPTGMIARTLQGTLIYLGPPQAVDAKLAALAVVIGHARNNKLRLLHVDVRPPERPAFRAVADEFEPKMGLG